MKGKNNSQIDGISFLHEDQAISNGFVNVIGVDEVGRGCLAGPVVAGAVILPRGNGINWLDSGIFDSKKLSVRNREELSIFIKNNAKWAIGVSSVDTINDRGIVYATHTAMISAISDLKEILSEGKSIKYNLYTNKISHISTI
jgi:ribonuclease HII